MLTRFTCSTQSKLTTSLVPCASIGLGAGSGRGHRKDHMEVADRQQIGFAGGKPVPRRRPPGTWGNGGCGWSCRQSDCVRSPAALDMVAEGPSGIARWLSSPLSWPRLTYPALARRQATPWRWKMSATSSLGRRPAAGLRSGSHTRFGHWRKAVERAGHRAGRLIGDAGPRAEAERRAATPRPATAPQILTMVVFAALPARAQHDCPLAGRGFHGWRQAARRQHRTAR